MLALIFNPAKNTRQFRRAVRLLDGEGVEYRVYRTASREDIAVQTRLAIAEGAKTLVACGGDGTLLWVINALGGRVLPVAVLPIGCSNDFARQLGIASVDDAVRAIVSMECIDVDLGECTFRDADGKNQILYFNSTAGFGILANLLALERFRSIEWSKRVLKDGIWPFLCLYALFRTRAVSVSGRIDERSFRAVMPLVEITKTSRNGGFKFIESASPTSHRLHVWRIEGSSKLTLLKILAKAVIGRNHIDNRSVFAADCGSFDVVPDAPYAVHLNGDVVGQTPALFSMGGATTPFVTLLS